MRYMKYDKVFTPGAPIQSRHYLFGREQELIDLKRICRRPGLHPIVIGNRGVGKTSLVVQAFANFTQPVIRIGCNPHLTFNILAHEILRNIGIDIDQTDSTREISKKVEGGARPFGVGVSTGATRKDTIKRRELGAETIDPWRLFQKLCETKKSVIIIIDEYESIPSSARDFHSSVAYLVKHLADHSHECGARVVVVVGVAQSAKDLLGRHESIERSAREIYLRPLRRDDILDFLTEAEKRLRFKFDSTVKYEIANSSMGYPYYVHLVGLECMDAMFARDKKAKYVTMQDYTKAIQRAVQHAFRSELRKYSEATKNLSDQERVLIKELVSFTKQVPRKYLQEVIEQKRLMTAAEFDHAWVRLQQEKHMVYVSRSNDTIRFSDPLLAPFLRSWIFRPIERKDDRQQSLFSED